MDLGVNTNNDRQDFASNRTPEKNNLVTLIVLGFRKIFSLLNDVILHSYYFELLVPIFAVLTHLPKKKAENIS